MFRSLRCMDTAAKALRQPVLRRESLRRQTAPPNFRRNRHATAFASQAPRHVQEEEYTENEGSSSVTHNQGSEDAEIVYPRPKSTTNPQPMISHLRQLFPPLDFPAKLAMQMLTHISAMEAWEGHNARLSFVGRRVLESYLLLFLESVSPSDLPQSNNANFEQMAYRALHTTLLGEHVGGKWDLAKVMLWKPPISNGKMQDGPRDVAKNISLVALARMPGVGLYKVQGTTVEAIIGGIFHQHGGVVAQRVFHTRVLPHILLPGMPKGLNDVYHHAAQAMLQRMGGPNAPLIRPKQTS